MTLAPGPLDLTSLAAAKSAAKVGASVTTDDDLLQRMVTQMSRVAMTWCNRDSFYGRTVTTQLTATKAGYLILPEYPVTSVSALASIGGGIPAAVAPTPGLPNQPSGYLLEAWNGIPPGGAQRLDVYGYGLVGGPGGVPITYRVGYEVIGEAATIPAAGPYTVAPLGAYGPAMADSGVVKVSTGAALTRIMSGTPAAGQYLFSQDATTGLWGYTFAAADTGAAVLISYSFSPWDVYAVIAEWVAERYKYRDRMGETSRAVATQQTAAYDTSAVPKFVQEILQQYRSVGPLF